ncbi:hypothetical protein [Arsenophonus endosymbiont of Aleurodicus floccissimus]|uniref:hypothetical protein n=1 Tax=Arsenophonus endosymbiont of Aleurodicus floccissimus TaxID=2152761 RepID=UPI002103E28C|nr:hypothetical protein [Arsenophonus endosymbiont of Aleurodicus floccissimus]
MGSNGSIAWGLTNAYASTFDFIRTKEPITHWTVHQEMIKVRKLLGGYDTVELNITVSPFGACGVDPGRKFSHALSSPVTTSHFTEFLILKRD